MVAQKRFIQSKQYTGRKMWERDDSRIERDLCIPMYSLAQVNFMTIYCVTKFPLD